MTGQDCGVAAAGGLVCQNFDRHDDEVRMESGPYEGYIFPACGRAAGGPDLPIPYTDQDAHMGGVVIGKEDDV